ncbi:MAG: TorF family putative porin [Gammaproteobacteria bacterium]|nr:TorF family putative porin [Gammaproteobacteria bacterium]
MLLVRFLFLFIFTSNIFALAELNPNSIYHFFNNNFLLSGTSTLTTNYVWRGLSRTNDHPAAQAGVTLSHINGIYSGVWGSNVFFANLELNYFAGYKHTYKDLVYDLNFTRFNFNNNRLRNLNYNQFSGSLAYNWVHGGISYAPKAFHTSSHNLYYTAGVSLPIPDYHSMILRNLSLNADLGYSQFEDGSLDRFDYVNYKLAINKKINKFNFNLALTDTNHKFHLRKIDHRKIFASIKADF